MSILNKLLSSYADDIARAAGNKIDDVARIAANKAVLVEINIGDEDSKSGIPYGQAMELVHQLSEYKNLTVKGLMCIPPIDATEAVRKYFAQMHKLFVDISSKKLDNIDMCILSMGMSGDYPWAIAEGSTLVRVGTGIFGQRNYNL